MSIRGGRESRDRYRREYPLRSEERNHHGRSSAPPSRHLWVGNLPHNVSEKILTNLFLEFGELDSVAFQTGRSYCFINFKIEDEAFAAVRALQGFMFAGNPLKIEFAKAEKATSSAREEGYSNRRDDQRSRLSPYSQRESRSRHPSPDSSYSEKPKMGDKNAEPSDVLWIGFPASLKVDEIILRRAFQPFGEIEKVTAFQGRSYAFVRFKNINSACRAKESLQGKLFGNPRVHICFARSEYAVSKTAAPSSPDLRSYSSGGRPGSSDDYHPDSYFENIMHPDHEPWRPELGFQGNNIYENRISPNRGTRYRELSPPPPQQFPRQQFDDDSWDLQEEAMGFPGAKKLKPNSFRHDNELPEYPFSDSEQVKRVLPRVSDFSQHENFDYGYKQAPEHGINLGQNWNAPPPPLPPYDNFHGGRSNPVDWKRLSPESHRSISPEKEWKWEGTIAKGGTPVCRARCFPVGKVLEMILPEYLDCTARTGLDMLAKHYYQAAGAWVVFFVPQTDADITFYNEFMHYLGEKQRAAVAKLDDKTTLFLVPPSNFSEKVLKVPGKLSISGVILRLDNPNLNPNPVSNPIPHLPETKDPNFTSYETQPYTVPPSPSGAFPSILPPFSNYAKPPGINPINHDNRYEQIGHQRTGPVAAPAAPNWSSSPHQNLQNPNHGPRSNTPTNSVNDPNFQGYNNNAVQSSSNYPPPPPAVATLQTEQLAQLASSLLGQRQISQQPESSYRGGPQNYGGPSNISNNNNNQAGSTTEYGGQVIHQHQQQQQLLMQQQQASNPPPPAVVPAGQSGTQEESGEDPQKRLQATLQLAAALLQQIQQGKGT